MKNEWDFIEKALVQQESLHRTRHLAPITIKEGAKVEYEQLSLIDFTSNDYLGLSTHPTLIERSKQYTSLYGASSSASRLLTGNFACFEQVEQKLSFLKKTESSLIFNSGYQANCTVLPVLADRHSLVLIDKLCHNSLLHGVQLSRARMLRFRHNDLGHLENLLKQHQSKGYTRIWIVTESLFGMEGDVSDLEKLSEIAQRFGALLYVDEAHATGVIGENGMGLSVGKNIDVVMGTFGKALGSFGAYVCMSEQLKKYLINFCPGFIYTTALPPSVIGSIDAALDLIPSLENERKELLEKSTLFRTKARRLGWNTGKSSTHIIPIFFGKEEMSLKASLFLKEKGLLGLAIRPPTVPDGQARIRFALSSLHTQKHLDQLFSALEFLKAKQ